MVALVSATALTISISEPEKAIFDKKIIVKDVIEITGQLVTFINAGNCSINATVDTSDMGIPASGATLWIRIKGIINVN